MSFGNAKQGIIKPGLAITPPEVEAKDERIQDRGERSKVWNIADEKRRLIVSMKALHYKNNPLSDSEDWRDIDLTLLPDKSCNKTQYDIQIFNDKVGFSYSTKRGGRVDIELIEVGGISVDNDRFNIVQSGNQLYWNNVADDIDIKVTLRPQSAELFKQLKAPTASKTFKWRIEKWKDSKCDFQRELSGIDSTLVVDKNGPGRLEINTDVTLVSKEIDRDIYTMEEEWTGRLSRIINLETRIKEWKTDPIYPVIIDDVVNEEITAGADDGHELIDFSVFYNSAPYINFQLGGGNRRPGLRFASVGIPQGAAISNATMGMWVTYCYTDHKPNIYFSNVDNAGQFTNNDRPSIMPNKIPAGGMMWSPVSSNGTVDTVKVTAAIQTIVSRGGWAGTVTQSLANMRCGFLGTPATGNPLRFAAYEHTANPPVQLDITFSVGGAAVFASISDGLGISDTIATKTGYIRSAIDSVGISDVLARIATYIRSLAVNLATTDTINTARNLKRSMAENVGVTDSITTKKFVLIAIADNLGITDVITRIITFVRSIPDTLAISDTLTTIRTIVRSIPDGIGITDVLTSEKFILVAIADNLGITDTLAKIMIYVRSVADGVSITDVITRIGIFIRSESDNLSVSDTVTASKGVFRTIADGAGVTDVLSAVVGKVASIADSLGITDVLTFIKTTVVGGRIFIAGIAKSLRISAKSKSLKISGEDKSLKISGSGD